MGVGQIVSSNYTSECGTELLRMYSLAQRGMVQISRPGALRSSSAAGTIP